MCCKATDVLVGERGHAKALVYFFGPGVALSLIWLFDRCLKSDRLYLKDEDGAAF
jgi:hypothetical protein